MAKIRNFGNTWANFFAEAKLKLHIWPDTPHSYMGKIRQIDTTSRKFFQHVSHHLMSKIGPFGNLFRKFFQIASHEYQQPSITPANPAGIASCQRLHIARCPSMQKSVQVPPPPEIFTGWFLLCTIAFRNRHQQGTSIPLSPPYLHGENQRFWKHLSKKFCRREAHAEIAQHSLM